MILGALKIARIDSSKLSVVPEQAMFVILTRMLYVITTWCLLPLLFGGLTSAYTNIALEYLFTLFDVVLGLLLIWFIISLVQNNRRYHGNSSVFGQSSKFDLSATQSEFDDSNIVTNSIRIRRDQDFNADTSTSFTNTTVNPIVDTNRVSIGEEFDDLITALQGPDDVGVAPFTDQSAYPGRSGLSSNR